MAWTGALWNSSNHNMAEMDERSAQTRGLLLKKVASDSSGVGSVMTRLGFCPLPVGVFLQSSPESCRSLTLPTSSKRFQFCVNLLTWKPTGVQSLCRLGVNSECYSVQAVIRPSVSLSHLLSYLWL